MNRVTNEVVEGEWVTFPGGELEGKRPKALCPQCREHLARAANTPGTARKRQEGRTVQLPRALCFACYRADIERERALGVAGESACGLRDEPGSPTRQPPLGGESESSSAAARAREGGAPRAAENPAGDDDRWQWLLPFEPVNRPRLEMLKAERSVAHMARQHSVGRFVDKRHRAQLAARHALQQIAAGLAGNNVRRVAPPGSNVREREIASAIHAAELQLPESWIPFVVSR